MTAREFAVLVNAKEIKRGKLWKAHCPAHQGKNRSLDISDGKRGVLLTCWSQHCTVKEICTALGIRVSDLFEGKATPEIRRRVSLAEAKEKLERQVGLFIMLQVTDKPKRRYWAAAERRARKDLFWVRWELERDVVEMEILKRIRG